MRYHGLATALILAATLIPQTHASTLGSIIPRLKRGELSARHFPSEYPSMRHFVAREGAVVRGGMLTLEGLRELKARDHVGTIISLITHQGDLAEEKAAVDQVGGIELIPIALPNFLARPKPEDVDRILSVLRSAYERAAGPDAKDAKAVYVHCRRGKDRTGLILGLYRVEIEGWEPALAYEEMLQFGFDPRLRNLLGFWIDRTGYDPR
jgi:hypothetical protein